MKQSNEFRDKTGLLGKYHMCDRCYQTVDFTQKDGNIRFCKIGGSDGLRAWRTPMCGYGCMKACQKGNNKKMGTDRWSL